MLTWPKASTTPWSARMRLAATRFSMTAGSTGPPEAAWADADSLAQVSASAATIIRTNMFRLPKKKFNWQLGEGHQDKVSIRISGVGAATEASCSRTLLVLLFRDGLLLRKDDLPPA